MKNKLRIIFVVLIVSITIFSCKEDELSKESILTIIKQKENAFDKWLKEAYVDPYNVQILYRYDDYETPLDRYVVPARYEKSIRLAKMIKYLCIESYEKHTPKFFLKKYFPKVIFFIGSNAYDNTGKPLLGLASEGAKMTLFGVNYLDNYSKEELVEEHFHTIFHEFSHVLHQTKDYPIEFKKISQEDYVNDSWDDSDTWAKVSSIEKGFISNYSAKEANEDFVELIATYVLSTQEQWEAKIEKGKGKDGNSKGYAVLLEKIGIVKSYLKATWDIDIDALRAEVQQRLTNFEAQDFDTL